MLTREVCCCDAIAGAAARIRKTMIVGMMNGFRLIIAWFSFPGPRSNYIGFETDLRPQFLSTSVLFKRFRRSDIFYQWACILLQGVAVPFRHGLLGGGW